MGTFTVTTPVSGHNGKVGDVSFVDGTATVDEDVNPSELAYFRGAGYGVTETDAETDDQPKTRRGRRGKTTPDTDSDTSESAGEQPAGDEENDKS